MDEALNGPEADVAWLSAAETHAIELGPGSRLVLDSEGLGWANLYAGITSERRWSGTLAPIDHTCFAYCLRRSATIVRHIHGEAHATTSVLRPRQIGLLPTRVASSWTLTGSADIMMVYIRGTLVERMARQVFGAAARDFDIRPRIGVLDPLLEQIALEIVAALHRRDPINDPLYIDHLAATAAAHLLRHHALRPCPTSAPPPPAPPRHALDHDVFGSNRSKDMNVTDSNMIEHDVVRKPVPTFRHHALGASLTRVRDHIEDNLDRDLSLDVLAREADLTATRFSQAFTATYGDTPHQYVIKRRVERTRQLLVGTDLPIAEVALRTGFSSQAHLSEVFKRVTGETPRAYRCGVARSPQDS